VRCGGDAGAGARGPREQQLLRIERLFLAAENTPPIRQGGHAARAVAGQPAIGAAETDLAFRGQFSEPAGVLNVLDHEPESALLRQSGIGVARHGWVRPGLVGRA
jgi:hypothetical protein